MESQDRQNRYDFEYGKQEILPRIASQVRRVIESRWDEVMNLAGAKEVVRDSDYAWFLAAVRDHINAQIDEMERADAYNHGFIK